MANNMKIVVNSIESKFNEDFFSCYRSQAIAAVEYYVQSIKKDSSLRTSQAAYNFSRNAAERDILSYHNMLLLPPNQEPVIQVFDSLRHAFSNYAAGGMHQLYTCQEKEEWYPEILLDEILRPNDIDELNEKITLYRGCDESELNNRHFGQSWTTSLGVAKAFAYIHYAQQTWFDKSKRVVIQTIIDKENVFFSRQTGEYEVAVNTNMLGEVFRIC
ncbi:hypothetical protein ACCW76_02135 [Pantoea sp. C8B4]|uniref:hypothetical protein n=1 Tax=Pantoea sp. C8B4 TaxID=3243083 RepID=UPI003ED959F1